MNSVSINYILYDKFSLYYEKESDPRIKFFSSHEKIVLKNFKILFKVLHFMHLFIIVDNKLLQDSFVQQLNTIIITNLFEFIRVTV